MVFLLADPAPQPTLERRYSRFFVFVFPEKRFGIMEPDKEYFSFVFPAKKRFNSTQES
jgi:hypothetical protein